jgi:hypothetical protein
MRVSARVARRAQDTSSKNFPESYEPSHANGTSAKIQVSRISGVPECYGALSCVQEAFGKSMAGLCDSFKVYQFANRVELLLKTEKSSEKLRRQIIASPARRQHGASSRSRPSLVRSCGEGVGAAEHEQVRAAAVSKVSTGRYLMVYGDWSVSRERVHACGLTRAGGQGDGVSEVPKMTLCGAAPCVRARPQTQTARGASVRRRECVASATTAAEAAWA